MKVYRVKNNFDNFQYFLMSHAADWDLMVSDCAPKRSHWVSPEVYIYEPLHRVGSLYNFGGGMPIFSAAATEILRTYLEMAGELLPIYHEGKEYTALNVLECINCLDKSKSTLVMSGEYLYRIERYVFYPDRFSESPIFKIPETYRSETLVLERDDWPDLPSYLIEKGLEGVILEELWRS